MIEGFAGFRLGAGCALALLVGVASTDADAATSVDYLEIFPSTSAASDELQLEAQGWFGGHTGDPFGSNPVGGEGALGGGAGAAERTPVNSNPVGSFPPSNFAFFSTSAVSNAFLYTNEVSFSSTRDFVLQWDSRNNANTVPGSGPNLSAGGDWYDQGSEEGANLHLALRVDDGATKSWFVSSEGFLHDADRNTWASNVQFSSDLNFFEFANGPADGSTLPGPGTTSSPGLPGSTVALPAGSVDAIGFYSARSAGTFRIDNVEIDVVPVPPAFALLLAGVAGLAMVRRRKSA